MWRRRLQLPIQSIILGVILLTILIYFPPYANSFVGDDYVQLDYVLEFVSRPLTVGRIFQPAWLGWYYRPLQNLWFLLHRLVFGYQPFGYYWDGLLVHVLVVAVAFRLLRRLGVPARAAAAATVLLAIHKHYVDVVAWISAIAIPLGALFALGCFVLYAGYVSRPGRRARVRPGWRLPATLLLLVLALFSHEEAVLLAPLLWLWRLLPALSHRPAAAPTAWRRGQRLVAAMAPPERVTLLLMAGLALSFALLHFTRPNLTILLAEAPASAWWGHLAPPQWTRFVAETVARLLPLPGLMAPLTAYSYPVTFLTALGVGFWFWRGDTLTRLGLAWAILHLLFIYWTLWTQKQELYAGRHLYVAWFGLVLAAGSSVARLLAGPALEGPSPGGPPRRRLLVALALAAVTVSSISIVRQAQASWLAAAREQAEVRRQMRALLPAVGDETHVFAVRFPITPNFLRSVTQVWYGRAAPLPQPAGPLSALRADGEATPASYLFDYDGQQLINLAPEFQQHRRTILLWSSDFAGQLIDAEGRPTPDPEPAVDQNMMVAGVGTGRRLALSATAPDSAEEWLSLAFRTNLPAGARLATAVRRHPDNTGPVRFRIRGQQGGRLVTLFEQTVATPDDAWHNVRLDVGGRSSRWGSIRLEIQGAGGGYWANPRLSVDS